ncbi:hypothetical protein [Aeromicrobium sp. IC_218]|uniref:hypothetical protein n=1 Tax=Aeromicrobium sp. IC_218 TaxID=2545468 RepID=UPI00103B258D|nr:hypothetical protein [Aeromicrobium sp. IC_218]TCI99619.1 hypothetical protein E0W78_04155 [Aeromicrobium sp. IC_218]
MNLRSAAVVLAVATVLGACSASESAEPRATPEPRPTAPVRTVDGEPLLTCGGHEFPVSAMVDGIESRTPAADIVNALDGLVRSAGMDAPLGLSKDGVRPGEWKVLAEDADSLLVATGRWDERGPGERAHRVGLEKQGDRLRVAGWGDCQPRPVPVDAVAWAMVTASAADLDPDAVSVPVRVTEQECTSSRDPEAHLHEPVVVETDRTVTVYWTTEVVTGPQKCPGNPLADRIIELDEPLGDRTVLDGSTWPAIPVTQRF